MSPFTLILISFICLSTANFNHTKVLNINENISRHEDLSCLQITKTLKAGGYITSDGKIEIDFTDGVAYWEESCDGNVSMFINNIFFQGTFTVSDSGLISIKVADGYGKESSYRAKYVSDKKISVDSVELTKK